MIRIALLSLALIAVDSPAFAQSKPKPPADPHAGHAMPQTQPAPAETTKTPQDAPVTPVPPLTDEDRAAAFPQDLGGHTVHDRAINYYALIDQLEWLGDGDTGGLNWDLKSWVGGDINRIWIHSEGVLDRADVDEAETHVTFGHAFARWWDVLAGVRHDFRPGPGQTWAAFGVQGLAPQWFEVQATLFVGESATTLARFEVEYELLVTNRVVLQPLVELNVYGKAIPERLIGAGLSSAEAGLRLRYEIRRELAPYVGLVWHREFGGTADLSRVAGEDTGGWRLAAGIRTWF